MAYQNVKTPRFYIDYINFNKATGLTSISDQEFEGISNNSPISGLSSPSLVEISTENLGDDAIYRIPMIEQDNNWCAVLGHNLASSNVAFHIEYYDGSYVAMENDVSLVNNNELDGFNIVINDTGGDYFDPVREPSTHYSFVFNSKNEDDSWDVDSFKIGNLCIGKYYDMPHSPDMSLTLTHDYSGVKTIETIGGSSLSNARWSKPSKWGDREAWQLGDFPYYYSGRRTWSLTWSFVTNKDIEPYNYYGNKYDGDVSQDGDDNWFQNVLYYTNGGQLQFIFNPDSSIVYYNDGTNPPRVPEFAICKFDMNSFSRKQQAPGLWEFSVKIKEAW